MPRLRQIALALAFACVSFAASPSEGAAIEFTATDLPDVVAGSDLWRYDYVVSGVIFDAFGERLRDRDFMTEWFIRRNREVIDALPPERLLVFSPKEGWEPLCGFLGVPVPNEPFPRINSRDELNAHSDEQGGLPPDPETAERFARAYIEELKAKAFG